MRIFTNSRDMTDYIQTLESIIETMAVDVSNFLKTANNPMYLYTAEDIIEDYAFVVSEPSVVEEVLYQEHGIPYLERESKFARLIRTGVVGVNTKKDNFVR